MSHPDPNEVNEAFNQSRRNFLFRTIPGMAATGMLAKEIIYDDLMHPEAAAAAEYEAKAAGIDFDRWDGTDREKTALDVSKGSFANGEAGGVVLVSREDKSYADSLTGTAFAKKTNSPVLLVSSRSIYESPGVLEEIKRVLQPNAEVTIVGGPGAVGPAIKNQLENEHGIPALQFGGENRYGTAAMFADTWGDTAHDVFIADASGKTINDTPWGLLAGAAGAALLETAPILLIYGTTVPRETSDWLARHPGARINTIGNTPSSVFRNAYRKFTSNQPTIPLQMSDISIQLANALQAFKRVGSNGKVAPTSFVRVGPDSLAAGAVSMPIFVQPDSTPDFVNKFIDANKADIDVVRFVGGTAAITAANEQRIRQRFSS